MTQPLSLAQSSFILSSLLSEQPHRLDERALLDARPLVLAPPVEVGLATVSLGETLLSCQVSTQVIKSSDQVDEEDRNNAAAADVGTVDDHTVGLWTVSLQTSTGCEAPVRNGGISSLTGNVELDAALEVLAHALRKHLFAVFPIEQFIILESPAFTSTEAGAASLRERLRGATFWNLSIDVTVRSMAGGNLYDAIWTAVYAALYRTRIPRTREVAYVPPQSTSNREQAADFDKEDVGIKSLKGQAAKGRAIDFELVDTWDEGLPLEGREDMGVGLTLGIVSTSLRSPCQLNMRSLIVVFQLAQFEKLPNYTHLLDPSLDEELCLPSSRRLFVVASASPPSTKMSPRLYHTRLLPSLLNVTTGEATRPPNSTSTDDQHHSLRFPKPPNAQYWEAGGWGLPDYGRVRQAIGVALPLAEQFAAMLRQNLQAEEAASNTSADKKRENWS